MKENSQKISCEIFSCEKIYEHEKAALHLRTGDTVEISMIAAGRGVYLVLDQAIPCKAGDIFVTPPGIPHRLFLETPRENLTVRQLSFHAEDWLPREFANKESPRYCYGVFSDGSVIAYAMLNQFMREKVENLFNTIEVESREERNEWEEVVGGCLAQLFIFVSRYIDSSIKEIAHSFSPKEWDAVQKMIRTVKGEFCDCTLTLEELANRLYVSKSYLSKTFQKITGQPFSEYLRGMRMEYACELLKKSVLSVKEIVERCGFRDVQTFYKNFADFKHMTPSEYRKSIHLSENISEKNKETEKGEKIMVILSDISENLQKGKAKIVKELVQQAIDEGSNPEQILNEGLLAGMNVIGEKFKNNEVFVPEVLVAARAMNMGAQILKPYLVASGVVATGKVCIGTVQGDLHDIGKNLVKMMMEGKGLEVVDLGTDVAAETFVQTAIEQNCQVICCSALLTTTMGVMADVVKAAEAAGVRDKIKIMIGGAPVNEDFCKQIGADCYTVDAASAADAAVELCK